MQVDYKLPLKYDKVFEGQKLSYVSFFASLESVQDVVVRPCIQKALKYCEELGIKKTQKLRLNLECQNALLELYTDSSAEASVALENIEVLCEELKGSESQLIQQKLVVLYCTLMSVYENQQKIDKF